MVGCPCVCGNVGACEGEFTCEREIECPSAKLTFFFFTSSERTLFVVKLVRLPARPFVLSTCVYVARKLKHKTFFILSTYACKNICC